MRIPGGLDGQRPANSVRLTSQRPGDVQGSFLGCEAGLQRLEGRSSWSTPDSVVFSWVRFSNVVVPPAREGAVSRRARAAGRRPSCLPGGGVRRRRRPAAGGRVSARVSRRIRKGLGRPPDTTAAPFAPGEVFAGRYRMITRIGRGGMGDVWRADDLVLGTAVALKVIDSTGSEARERILNEVRLARQITHPAVCRVFDVGEAAGWIFFSMELVSRRGSRVARSGASAGCRPRRSSTSPASCAPAWRPRTHKASSIAISNPPTCSSTTTGWCGSPTSGSRFRGPPPAPTC